MRRCGGRSRRIASQLGERFRFFHVAPLAGFKAGALNFALAKTAVRCRSHRRHRQRLYGRAGLAARPGAELRRSADRDRAGAAGLPRRAGQCLQGHVLCRVPRLLLYRHDHAQRAQRHHPARHDDAGAPQGARARSAAGPSGASPRMPSSACACSRPATRPPTCPRATAAG